MTKEEEDLIVKFQTDRAGLTEEEWFAFDALMDGDPANFQSRYHELSIESRRKIIDHYPGMEGRINQSVIRHLRTMLDGEHCEGCKEQIRQRITELQVQ